MKIRPKTTRWLSGSGCPLLSLDEMMSAWSGLAMCSAMRARTTAATTTRSTTAPMMSGMNVRSTCDPFNGLREGSGADARRA